MDVSVESALAPAVREELKRRGHKVVSLPDDYNQFGCAQLVWKLDGGYFAASDPRRDGQAVGY
jgi:gamma-glutamyltranspeptidase/glutathione hydrolase